MDWQPMSAAPKDGTVFLVYMKIEGELTPLLAAYVDGQCRALILCRDGGYGVHGNYAPLEPKYWMPLPEPPKT